MSIVRYQPKHDVKPYYPCVLDIETRKDGSVMHVGFCWDVGGVLNYSVFNSWKDWLNFYRNLLDEYKYEKIAKYEKYLRVYAHNGGNFDWLSLIEYFGENEEDGKLHDGILIHSKMIGCKIDIGFKSKVWLLDSICLLPKGLDDLSKIFNIDHQKLSLDGRLPEEIYAIDRDLYFNYLKNDVLGLSEIIQKFWSMLYSLEGNIGNLPITLASLSMRLWRKSLASDVNIRTSWNDELKMFERRSYTGGRVQVFEYGYHDYVTCHDINSLYPSVMIDMIAPISYSGCWVDKYEGEYGIYEINYVQNNEKYPSVLRDENSGEFSYRGSGVFTHYELDLLLEVGGMIEVKQGYIYYELDTLFKDFIDKWYSRRKEYKSNSNIAMDYVCKILMNSLYGKFGQKEVGKSIEISSYENEEKWIENNWSYIDYGNYSIVEKPIKVDNMFCIIASMVTSLSRIKLYRFMMNVIDSGKTLIYCDTDSVHSNGADLFCSDELGDMKLEKTGSGTYIGKKLYELIGEDGKRKVVAKGVGRDSHKKIIDYDFAMLNLGYEKRIEFNTAPTVREILAGKRNACQFFNRHRKIRIT